LNVDKKGRIISLPFFLFSFCISLSLYIYTLAPTVTFQDSGEYIVSAYNLGIPHPPGNPTWCMVAKLFTYLPIGNIAYRVNFMSAFFAALSVALSFLIFRKIFSNDTLSFILSLIVATTSSLWEKAVVAEVHTLNLFFMLTIILMVLRIPEVRQTRWFIWIGVLAGIGTGNHMMLLFLFPAILIYLLSRKIRPKDLFLIFFGFSLGLLVYLYLPLRSLKNPVPDSGDPENLSNFLWVMLRKQWGGIEWKNITWPAIKLGFKSINLIGEFTLIGVVLGITGFINLFFKKRILFISSFLIFLFYSLGMIILVAGNLHPSILCRPFIDEFFIPAHWVYVLWIGSGTLVLMKRKEIFIILTFVIMLVISSMHFPKCNFRNFTLGRDIGIKLLEDIEKDGIVFSIGDDISFILLYLQEVEGIREDVIVMDRNFLSWPSYFSQYKDRFSFLNFPDSSRLLEFQANPKLVIRDIITENIGSRPVYWVLSSRDQWIEDRLIPNGMTFKVLSSPIKHISEDIITKGEKKWLKFEDFCFFWLDKPTTIHGRFLMGGLTNQMGIYFHQRELYDRAISYYTKAKIFSPGIISSFYNLGLLYWYKGEIEHALHEFQCMVALDPYSHDGYFNLGKAYEKLGNFTNAIAAYNRSKKLAPYYADTHYHLGRCLENVGKVEEGRASYAEALRLDPDYEKAKNAIEKLEK